MSGPRAFRLDAASLKALSTRRNGPALWRAGAHLAVVAAGMAALLATRDSLWCVPLIWLTGYPLAFLFCPMHECAHQTAFKTRALNIAMGHLCGLLILLPYEYYRLFHWDHHRHTQQAGRDPEMALALPHSRLGAIWLMLGFPIWFKRMVPTLLRHALGRVSAPWVSSDQRGRVVLEARCYLMVYGLIAAWAVSSASWLPLLLWLLPLAAGHMLLRPYLLAEHTGCGHSTEMLQNSRSIDTNGLVRFFAWNMPLHAEHHAYPAVPFHALAGLRALALPHLAHRTAGYRQASRLVWRHLVARSPDGAQGRVRLSDPPLEAGESADESVRPLAEPSRPA